MSESHNERADVPELTADQIQARVLHRDGLMLVIDKPAGLPVHRGPEFLPPSMREHQGVRCDFRSWRETANTPPT